jgi:catechol 2,3-dioxygenase-like lactoylglutathione lyase family enzyme
MSINLEGLAPLFQVFDMPSSLGFYRDVLGFRVVSKSRARGARRLRLVLTGA